MHFTVFCVGAASLPLQNKYLVFLECGHTMVCDTSAGEIAQVCAEREVECCLCRRAYFSSLGMVE